MLLCSDEQRLAQVHITSGATDLSLGRSDAIELRPDRGEIIREGRSGDGTNCSHVGERAVDSID